MAVAYEVAQRDNLNHYLRRAETHRKDGKALASGAGKGGRGDVGTDLERTFIEYGTHLTALGTFLQSHAPPSANVSADARIQTTAAPPITAAARHLQVTVPRPPAVRRVLLRLYISFALHLRLAFTSGGTQRSGRVTGLGTSSKDGGGSGLKERERQRIREAERTKRVELLTLHEGTSSPTSYDLYDAPASPPSAYGATTRPRTRSDPHNAYSHFGDAVEDGVCAVRGARVVLSPLRARGGERHVSAAGRAGAGIRRLP
ncbi:hypothetical protein DFH09DRAFT_1474961 [Mycena vulgaris]|nr:hypothetical protein DFH09DRAFT_1474961 [Mycena vulgaris]